MINWIKTLFKIVKFYGIDRENLQKEFHQRINKLEIEIGNDISNMQSLVRDLTTVSADIGGHRRSGSYAIIIGRYKKQDFVQTYELNDESVGSMINQLKEMERFAHAARIDCPPTMRMVFDREFKS